MSKNKHLSLQDRITIHEGLNNHQSFRAMAKTLGKDPTTIAKEVKRNATVVNKGCVGRAFNPCKHRKDCSHANLCNVSKCKFKYCRFCSKCTSVCPDFQEEICPNLSKPPYVCNGCERKNKCSLRKKEYRAATAQQRYETQKSECRQGIFSTPEELEQMDSILKPLIDQGQSIHHICVNHRDKIMVDEKTIYKYINNGLLSSKNIDLPRKVKYRPRNKKRELKLDRQCYVGRTYQDFLAFIAANPDMPVVEMDSVEGRKGGKVLLTLFFRVTTFMKAYLRPSNTAHSVTEIIEALHQRLGNDMFEQLMSVILTDRGSEFSNPKALEFDQTGRRRCYVFYCDANSPNQKGSIEVCHEMIRRILPKGTNFDGLEQSDCNTMMDHINSYKRKKLNNWSPHQLFSTLYGNEVLDSLHSKEVETNAIQLTPKLLQK